MIERNVTYQNVNISNFFQDHYHASFQSDARKEKAR